MTNEKGFSLTEVTISMALALALMGGVYAMILHVGEASRSKHANMRMLQESRYILTSFASEIKDAGAMVSLAKDLNGKPAYFTGIIPLNAQNVTAGDNFGDGILVTSAEPGVYYEIKESNSFQHGQGTLSLRYPADLNTEPDFNDVWTIDDMGIIVGEDGFYIFKVEKVEFDRDSNNRVLTLRTEPVYYSGLLETTTTNYKDFPYSSGVTGADVSYPEYSSVFRLTNFGIYLFRTKTYNINGDDRTIRQWIRVNDAKGQANLDVAEGQTQADVSVVSENIWNMQISYSAFNPATFSSVTTATYTAPDTIYYKTGGSNVWNDLIDDFRTKAIREVTISVVAITDEYAGQGQRTNVVPPLGDQEGYTMPPGKYDIKVFTFNVETRNLSINIFGGN